MIECLFFRLSGKKAPKAIDFSPNVDMIGSKSLEPYETPDAVTNIC